MYPFCPLTALACPCCSASKKVLYGVYNFMADHFFQMTGQFLTDYNYIFDKSCCFQLLE
jgi:hypothetical protein